MNPNSVLSQELKVRQLQKDEVVIYKLCASDEKDYSRIDEETNQPRMKQPGFTTADRYNIYDHKLGRNVTIGNVISWRQEIMPDRSTKDVPVLGPVRFPMGKAVTLTSKDQATFEFLERLDINVSNPFRNPKSRSVFYRVDERKVAADKNHKNLILADALTWIGNADSLEVKSINEGLPDGMKLNLNDPFDVIKDRLFELTKNDPIMIMKASGNTKVKIKIQVMDAAKYEIIVFDEGDGKRPRSWYLNRSERPTIMTVDVGKNKIEALVEHFQTTEGVKLYKTMVSELKSFLRSGAVGA